MLNTDDKQLIKQLNKLTKQSEYYAQFTKRKYRHIKGYIEYDSVMFEISRTRFIYDYYPIETFEEDFVHRNSLLCVNNFLLEGFSSLWLAPNLLRAFLHTDPPQKLYSFKRVIKNCVLFLPEGLRTPDGNNIQWLLFSHRLTTDDLPPVELHSKTIHAIKMDKDSLAITFYDQMRYQYSTNRSLEIIDDILLSDSGTDFVLRTNEQTDKDVEKDFMDVVSNLVINVLLFLQTYEEKEVAQNVVTTKSRSKKPSKQQKLEPYVVGAHYVTKQQVEKSNVGKTGVRKAQHWRRGHYRRQMVGKREKPENKLVWIEPVLVNGVE